MESAQGSGRPLSIRHTTGPAGPHSVVREVEVTLVTGHNSSSRAATNGRVWAEGYKAEVELWVLLS
jgi:hypothetical protein